MLNKNLYLGVVYDAMYALGYRTADFYIDLKPLAGYSHLIFGPAFTTFGRCVSKNEKYNEVDQFKYKIYNQKYFKNKPIVMLQANDSFCAHFGEISSLIYKQLGAVGFITDGNTRDADLINEYKFPVFCNNINPIDALDHWALVDCNSPIVIKNIDIEPKDWIFASSEGVIRVKRKDKLNFKKSLKEILDKEKKTRIFISKLTKYDSLPNILKDYSAKHGRW